MLLVDEYGVLVVCVLGQDLVLVLLWSFPSLFYFFYFFYFLDFPRLLRQRTGPRDGAELWFVVDRRLTARVGSMGSDGWG